MAERAGGDGLRAALRWFRDTAREARRNSRDPDDRGHAKEYADRKDGLDLLRKVGKRVGNIIVDCATLQMVLKK